MAEKKTKSNSMRIPQILTGVLLLAKLLESPYMESVPFWSFNPITFSVFIVYTWTFWVLLGLGIIYIILTIYGKKVNKRYEETVYDIIKNAMKKDNLNN